MHVLLDGIIGLFQSQMKSAGMDTRLSLIILCWVTMRKSLAASPACGVATTGQGSVIRIQWRAIISRVKITPFAT